MRKELYEKLCEQLSKLYVTPDGSYGVIEEGATVPDGWWRAIRHVDLWNHNVEFLEQEDQWERPAVFWQCVRRFCRQCKRRRTVRCRSSKPSCR